MLDYSVITAARNEAPRLPHLGDALERQTRRPDRWVIVENGSTDGTLEVAHKIARRLGWVRVLTRSGSAVPVRGAPIVRSLTAGLDALEPPPSVVVNVDADITMEATYFEQLLAEFSADPRLGIASGSAWELDKGQWRQRHVTGDSVWGATRAYRWECLQIVLPLEERLAWDGVDEAKARARGWTTRTFTDLPFRHHRAEGERDGSALARWAEVGRSCHYMGYRVPYLAARAAHYATRDPAAIGMLWGFLVSAARREEQLDDDAAKEIVRSGQRLRHLHRRRREAVGRR